MKYKELAKKEAAELDKLEAQTRLELMKHEAQVATGAPGKDSGKVRELKKDIARIKMARAQRAPQQKGGVSPK